MPDEIKCPVCGESNAADQEFCQYCQSRLRPLTGPLRGADAPLRPGQIPTKKVTAELEPILPQWLREARDKARHSVEEDTSQVMQQQEQTQAPVASEPDLLAGLRSQSRGEDEEDTPDWLASITGVTPKSKKAGSGLPEARRVELGDRKDFAGVTGSLEESTPAWLGGTPAASQESEKDELKDWFKDSSGLETKQAPAPANDFSVGPGPIAPSQGVDASSPAEAPDWLRKLSADDGAGTASAGSIPSWLGSDMQEAGQDANPSTFAEPDVGGFETDSQSADGQTDNEWMRALQSPKPDKPLRQTTPLWLKNTGSLAAASQEAETPVWLENSADLTSATPSPSAPVELPPAETQPDVESDAGFGGIPDWLKAAAPQSSIFDEAPAQEPQVVPPEASGWLSTFKSSEPVPATPFSAGPTAENAPSPAFTPDAFGEAGVDALFTEMPDWLSSAAAPTPPFSPAPSSGSDVILPGELPSWVQAMRPVDTSSSRPVAQVASDETLETRGALSGLQGVLPAVPGYGPSSKPKAYSIRLQATQEQQAHASLLEQILAAEAEPVPITSFSPLAASRPLRWFISLAVVTLIALVTSLNTRIFSMPVGVPNEFSGALQVAQNVPEGAPVLVAFDYHPSRAGEMEAAAAPMFDQMLVLRHPRLTFISTNETGPILAERFIAGPLSERGYQPGSQYLNLGYLPGSVMGIRAFAQNPVATMPFDTSLSPAWISIPLQGVSSLSQFAALIVITDSADSARAWIEQTTSTRGSSPLVIVASAQAAPMVMPYYASGQVSGIVNGLYGGAIFEQNNAGRPGTARNYWDAYSLGMLLAMSFMLGGGLWSMAFGLRDRAASTGAI